MHHVLTRGGLLSPVCFFFFFFFYTQFRFQSVFPNYHDGFYSTVIYISPQTLYPLIFLAILSRKLQYSTSSVSFSASLSIMVVLCCGFMVDLSSACRQSCTPTAIDGEKRRYCEERCSRFLFTPLHPVVLFYHGIQRFLCPLVFSLSPFLIVLFNLLFSKATFSIRHFHFSTISVFIQFLCAFSLDLRYANLILAGF